MTAFLGVIDGTGPLSDDKYRSEMANSFCRQLYDKTTTVATYERGPSGEGYYIERRSRSLVEAAVRSGADAIYIAGYSRGGSAAVIAARMLAERGRGVKALFLFDPVARHGSASSAVIPGNVENVYTARRLIGDKRMDKYDYVLFGDLAGHNPVRNWFGTTATRFESSTTRRRETYELGSHGALGGVGWRDVSEDAACQTSVATFFNQALREEGLAVTLESFPPSSLF